MLHNPTERGGLWGGQERSTHWPEEAVDILHHKGKRGVEGGGSFCQSMTINDIHLGGGRLIN